MVSRADSILIGFGALLGVVLALEFVWIAVSGGLSLISMAYLVGIGSTIPGLIVLIVGGRHLSQSSLSPSQQFRVLKFSVAGASGFLLVNAALMFTMPPARPLIAISWGRWAVSIGAGAGFLIGYYEAQAVHRAVKAERASLQAKQAEERREMLDYLNSLLRHEVLNTAAVISGYADLLKGKTDQDDDAYEHLEVISRQTTELTATTQDVRVLLQSLEEGVDLEPVDLVDLLETELGKLADRHDHVEIDVSIPDDVYVRADELLKRVFSNLLDNAVEHNQSSAPRVTVSVSAEPDTVEVRIADNGSGVPDGKRDLLFQTVTAKTDHGIGLTIVGRLVDRYGGNVELTETGPDGSVFTVSLPRATKQPDEENQQAQPATV
jgi:signal transduction histidine kinase